jgi:hypothetical protein
MKQHILAVVVVLGAGGLVAADEVRGRIVSVDLARKEMVVRHGPPRRGADYRFVLDDKTEVLFAGEPGKVTDLPTGRMARVAYEDQGGKPVARVIRIPLPLGVVRGATPPAPPPAAETPAGDSVSGTLLRVGVTDRELVVVGPGRKGAETETTIAVPEDVPITRDGKKIGLDNLKEGDGVSVQVERKGSQVKARSVQVGKAPPAPAAMRTDKVVPRVRQVLKIVDQILQQIEQQRQR